MEKKKYVAPAIEIVRMSTENIMLIASPGVGGDYDPTQPIEAKKNNIFEDEIADEWPSYSSWGEYLLTIYYFVTLFQRITRNELLKLYVPRFLFVLLAKAV